MNGLGGQIKEQVCLFHGDGFEPLETFPKAASANQQHTYADAKAFAAKGCLICSVIAGCIHHFSYHWSGSADSHIWWRINTNPKSGLPCISASGPGINGGYSLFMELYVHDDSRLPGSSPFSILESQPLKEICHDPLAESTFFLVKRWIASCTTVHSACAPIMPSTKLPTRILDVGLDSSDNILRLYEPCGKRGLYIALSHCWGDPSTVTLPKTTQSTLKAHLDGIEWSSLSKTFQDAVTITRKLGIQYIWIDSLCIIQGDKEDWEVESAKMASVYGDAYLVIFATVATNGSHGCSLGRPRSHEVSVTDTNGHLHTLFVRERLGDEHGILSNPMLGSFALLERGWVFQERLLAQRVIHYGNTELIWECKSEARCECSQNAHEGNILKLLFQNILDGPVDRLKFMDLWWDIIDGYTRARLTYTSDRLVGISSLARRLHCPTLGRYFAGLWEHCLLEGLLWIAGAQQRTVHFKNPGLSDNYIPSTVPSWSWASVEHWIHPHKRGDSTHTPRVQIFDISCEPENPKAPFGNVRNAELTCFAQVIPAILDRSIELKKGYYLQATLLIEGTAFTFFMDNVPESDQNGKAENEIVYCLWLQSSIQKEVTGELLPKEFALVLRQQSDPRMTYKRIGLLVSDPEALRSCFSFAGENIIVLV